MTKMMAVGAVAALVLIAVGVAVVLIFGRRQPPDPRFPAGPEGEA